MNNWKKIKIGDVGKVITGKTPSTSKKIFWNNGTIPFVTPSDNISNKYIESTKRYITKDGLRNIKNCFLPINSICVSCIGSDLGKVVINKTPCVTNQQINSIIVNKNYDTDFIYYQMLIVGEKLNFLSKTSTAVPIINKSQFSEIEIPLPPLPTQRRIAAILSALDDKIENNRRICENLEQIAQALFKRWFVDFDFPDEQGRPYKSSGGRMVESELGLIPEGWEVSNFTDVANISSGYSYKGNELIKSSNAMITIKNFDRNGGFKIDGLKEIEISDRVKKEHYVNEGDIVVAHTDLTQKADIIGNPILIYSKGIYDKLITSMDTVKVVSINKDVSNSFLYQVLASTAFKNFALGYVNGTTVLHLSKKCLKEYKIALPVNKNYTKQSSELFSSIFDQIIIVNKENEILTQTRDTLLPKLMSGEVEV